jgi:hypothetical protein
MECADIRTAPGVLPFAQTLASRMFASIGVAIGWRSDLRGCPAEGILINLSFHTLENVTPSALAYAKPYEGKHILLLYDRIACERQIPFVLGHILTHEISHMLQGICRHSASGIMKAHWTRDDSAAMASQQLTFEQKDVDLIYLGLARRGAPRGDSTWRQEQ